LLFIYLYTLIMFLKIEEDSLWLSSNITPGQSNILTFESIIIS
jgi:hypothetical protein